MAFTHFRRLFLLTYVVHTCVGDTELEDKGFSGYEPLVRGNITLISGTETPKKGMVSPEAKRVLSSYLTTVFLPIIYIIVFAVGLPANALAIWVFLFRVKKKHSFSIYMANLALADLLFVIWVPLKIAYHFNNNDWIFGEGLCKVLIAFFYGNMYCSILFITCISVQRYWAVVHPLSELQKDNRMATGLSIAIWVIVWAITVPLYLYEQEVRVLNMNIVTCHDVTRQSQKQMAAGYFLTMGAVGFIIPLFVCIVSYVLMLKALQNSMSDPTIAKKRRKAIVLIITVLVMFIVCFGPSNIMLIVHYSLLLSEVTDNLYGIYMTTLCLASLNSCIDPFVYYFISKDFRKHMNNSFLRRTERIIKRKRDVDLIQTPELFKEEQHLRLWHGGTADSTLAS
ncbi:hypothetical protein WMY93_021239 [Mugilogobius chulae]|uniref:G-protein coupled receptors family 1 profile domain-containing protein n=1 Tax=Mugilogobius chulae TaxID=88201 RepID=A0AAW0NLB4_9GOBI